MENQVTFKKILIAALVNQTARVSDQSLSKQVHSSIALKNTVEAVVLLKQSDICVITEEEINQAIVKMQLNSLVQTTPN